MILILSVIRAESSFMELYGEYKPLMRYIAWQILGDGNDVEDAVQDAFIKIHEKFDNSCDIKCHKTKSYVVIVIRSTALNIYRKRKRQKTVSVEETGYIETSADENDVKPDLSEELAKKIALLPQNYRDVVMLRFYHDKSYGEIAKIMGTNKENVRKITERAVKKLRELIGDELK